MRKNPTLKYLRSWNLHSKLYLAIIFWAILLMISFENLILIFYIWIPNTTMEGITIDGGKNKMEGAASNIQKKLLRVFLV